MTGRWQNAPSLALEASVVIIWSRVTFHTGLLINYIRISLPPVDLERVNSSLWCASAHCRAPVRCTSTLHSSMHFRHGSSHLGRCTSGYRRNRKAQSANAILRSETRTRFLKWKFRREPKVSWEATISIDVINTSFTATSPELYSFRVKICHSTTRVSGICELLGTRETSSKRR